MNANTIRMLERMNPDEGLSALFVQSFYSSADDAG